MIKKQPTVPKHSHGDIEQVVATRGAHHTDHETGGVDAIAALAATVINSGTLSADRIPSLDASKIGSGTLDGDRLPAISTTKKGAVPAVTPASPSEFLRDTGDFERVAQADVNGLETTATPQFAGLGIKTPGSDNHLNLIDGAIIGNAAGGYLKFNVLIKLLELLVGDVAIGNTPAVPGTGGTWSESYDSDAERIYCLCPFLGKLYAGSYAGGKIYVYDGSSWSESLDLSTATYISGLCVFGTKLIATCNDYTYVYYTTNGVDWVKSNVLPNSSGSNGAAVYGSNVYSAGSYEATIAVSADGITWGSSTTTSGYAATSLLVAGAYLLAGLYGANPYPGRITRFNGSTWATVLDTANGDAIQSMFLWNGKVYAGTWSGKVYISADNGTTWTSITLRAGYNIRAFIENGAALWASSGNRIYETTNGTDWSLIHTSSETEIFSFGKYINKVYYGTSTIGKIFVYTDNTAVFAPLLTAFGNLKLYGQFRPGDMAGVIGNLLMSGGSGAPSWLGNGTATQFLGGGATPAWVAAATQAIGLLSAITVPFDADGATTLYTVPTGKRCVLSHAIVVAGADAGATTMSIGQVGALTDFLAVNTLSNLDAQYDAVRLEPIPNTTPLKGKSYAATTVIQADVGSHAGGATNTVYLFGFLY